jgi:hypothetical protein
MIWLIKNVHLLNLSTSLKEQTKFAMLDNAPLGFSYQFKSKSKGLNLRPDQPVSKHHLSYPLDR